jgi:hypothetical protein
MSPHRDALRYGFLELVDCPDDLLLRLHAAQLRVEHMDLVLVGLNLGL